MELVANLGLGFATALSIHNLLYCFIGVLLGTFIGLLPGIGPIATIALLLPITFGLEPVSALIMLAGIYYGSQYGGSTTAILINLPGEASSAVTAIDGYKMAQQGRAGAALASAALGSFFAGTVATLLIAVFAPPLTKLALSFGSVEYFALIVLGLIASVALAHGSILKAIAMIVLGLLLGTVGTDLYTGARRFTLGTNELADGVDLVAVAVGIFGLAEILRNLEDERSGRVLVHKLSRIFPTMAELRAITMPVLRGTGIGSVLGVLPGGGALLASFASYAVEKKISRNPERFGNGAIEGVASPESANNAGAQTSFIPMLSLGLPSNAIMALMIGALTLQGIMPGPNVATTNPELFWGLIASMWIGNAMLIILNLPLIGLWIRLLTIPYHFLVPSILVFSAVGVYSVGSNTFDVYTICIFGLLGYILSKLEFEPAPLLLGFVIGPMLEEHLRRAMLMSRGDPLVFLQNPISAALLVIAAAMLILVLLPSLKQKREEIFQDSE